MCCNIRLKFLVPLLIAIPTVFLLLISGIVTLSLLFPKTDDWSGSIQTHMVGVEQNGINMTTSTLSTLTSTVFASIISDMDLITQEAQSIFDSDFEFKRSSTPYESLGTQPPGGLDSDGKNIDYSAWFSKNGATTYLQNATYMNEFWSATYRSNPLYQGLYLGFSDGLFVHLPYRVFDSYPTQSYLCLSTNQQVTGYDPTCRGWYILATQNPSSIILTPPYADASTGVVIITAAKAIFSSTNELIGAAGIDISMNTLATSITERRILSNGYPFLIQNNQDGTIVLHPRVPIDTEEVQDLFDVEPITSTDYLTIRSTDRAQIIYGNDQLLTWDQALYDYNLLTSVPNSDIVAPTTQIRDDVSSRKGWAIGMMVGFTLGGSLLMVFASSLISSKIGTDIRSLGTVFASGNFDEETGTHYSKETRTLSDLIHLMSRITKFAYAKSLSLDNSAFELYDQVQKHMRKIDNPYGEAAAIGAKANHLVRLSDRERLDEALGYFDECIQISERLHATREDGSDMRYLRIVANRYMNRGVLKMNMNRWSDAEMDFAKASEYFDEIGNAEGQNKVEGNRGLLLLRRNREESAGELLKKAYNDALAAYDAGDSKRSTGNDDLHDLGAALQYASLNYGKYLVQTGHEARALPYFREALTLQLTTDATLIGNCLMEISSIAERRELSNVAKEIQSYIPGHKRKYRMAIDLSGSMRSSFRSGATRIEAVRESLLNILDELNYGDEVQIVGFADELYNVTNGGITIRGDNIEEIKAQVEDNTETKGGTAFYHAVNSLADDMIADEEANENQIIIALTDGEDTSSSRHNVNLEGLQNKIDHHNIRLVIISVAMKDRYVQILRNLTRAEGNLLIEANNAEAITTAMTQAVRMMKGQLARETFI